MLGPAHDITIGDRAPDFVLPAADAKFYEFYERVRGRPAVLLFYPGRASETWAGVDVFAKRQGEFDKLGIDIFAVTLDGPKDIAKCDLPFFVWSDPNQAITTGYFEGAGILPARRTGAVAFLLDANQRVLAIQDDGGIGSADAVYRFYQALPSPAPNQVLLANAPILLMPNLIDPQMCQDLMEMWERDGHEEGMVGSVIGSDEIRRVHTKVKKRRDHRIMNKVFHHTLQRTIGRRIAPELEKAFHFTGFRFDRFVVVCYDSARGDYFRVHRDNLSPETADRVFALTVNLNAADYEGGEIVFPEYGPHKYRTENGGAVLFSCALMHEALPVTKGRRFALLTFLRTEAEQVTA